MKKEFRLYIAEKLASWAYSVAPEGELRTVIHGYFQKEIVKTWKTLHNPPPPPAVVYPQMVHDIIAVLNANNYKHFSPVAIDYGYQIKTFSGSVVTVYQTGRINVQGKPDEKLKQLFK
jgi:hypothetical protein